MEKKRDNSETKNIVRYKIHILTLIHSYTFRKIHMKHNCLCKNLSDIGNIQQIQSCTYIIFFAITDSNNTNTHTKTLTTHSQHSIQCLHNDMDLI